MADAATTRNRPNHPPLHLLPDATGDPARSALVVAAKLRAPRLRPEAIRRSPLVAALEAATDRPITLLCAPAGFGKTSTLIAWMAATERRVAWLGLDPQDGDPVRFLAHVLAALESLEPGITDDAARALTVGADLTTSVVTRLSNALATREGEPLVLVLDDLHAVDDAATLDVLARVLESAPPRLRVVIATRTAPPISLARRRVAGDLTELGPRNLAFDAEETARFLVGTLGLPLGAASVEQLGRRTDGWPAGLSLAAISLRAHGEPDRFVATFAGSDRHVTEYLMEEVLHAVDDATADFLVRTSILRRLNPSLCRAVLDDRNAAALLQASRDDNLLLTATDEDGQWVRYHHLLSDLLRAELERRSPELVPTLHARAARWFVANGFPEDGIEHAIDSGDGAFAAEILHDHWRTLSTSRRFVTVDRILDRLPADVGPYRPFLDAYRLLCQVLVGAGRQVWERLPSLLEHRDAPGVAELLEVLEINPIRGNVGASLRAAPAALQSALGDPERRYVLATTYASLLWLAGRIDEARMWLAPEHAVPTDPATDVWRLSVLSRVAADSGDVAEALRCSTEAIRTTVAWGGESVPFSATAYQAHTMALLGSGHAAEARQALEHATSLTAASPDSIYALYTALCAACVHLEAGATDAARGAVAEARRLTELFPDVGRMQTRVAEFERVLTPRLALRTDVGTSPTPAEMRVLRALVGSASLRDIAGDLHLSLNTVRSHARRIYRRLEVNTREDAVRVARQRGLL